MLFNGNSSKQENKITKIKSRLQIALELSKLKKRKCPQYMQRLHSKYRQISDGIWCDVG